MCPSFMSDPLFCRKRGDSKAVERIWHPMQERWLEPNAEMARRVVPEQSAASGCSSSSRNNLSSSQTVSSVAVDCTASRPPLCAQDKAGDCGCTAEEACRGGMPSSGVDLGTSPDSHHEQQKVSLLGEPLFYVVWLSWPV